MNNQPVFSLAVDIGGTKLETGLIDLKGTLLTRIDRVPTPFEKGIASLEGILGIIDEYLRQAKSFDGILRGIGISSCGLVDLQTGVVIVSPNQHWYGVPLGQSAKDRFKLPVYLATDTRLATIGEATWGAGRGLDNFAWVTLGTGFGAALFLQGKLFGGERGFAGAIGHNTVDEIQGFPCGCGRRGCLETYTSGRALARNGQAIVDMGHKTLLKDIANGQRITAEMVFLTATQGDPASSHLVDQLIRYTAIGISQIINILDINLIIMGGGLTKAGPEFIKRINEETRKHLFNAEAAKDIMIIKETLPNSALFGAAANVFMQCSDLDKIW